eukprot:5230337-Karenia_brevis.AAC.1
MTSHPQKVVKGAARQKKYLEEHHAVVSLGSSVLEERSISAATKKSYQPLQHPLEVQFLHKKVTDSLDKEVDQALVEFMSNQVFAGEASGIGTKMLAAMYWLHPERGFTQHQ